jgi:hypothetical protein
MQLRKQQLFNVEVINNKNVDKLQSWHVDVQRDAGQVKDNALCSHKKIL